MRINVNSRGKVSVSASKKIPSGCLTFIGFFVIIAFFLGKCSGSDEDDVEKVKAEAESFPYAVITANDIYENICTDSVTTDGAKYYYDNEMSKKWLTLETKVLNISRGTLTSETSIESAGEHKLSLNIKIGDSKPPKKGEIINVKFIPSSFYQSSCNIYGELGEIIY
ncbi:hypothetical protein DMA29_03150 [Salmonella enterica subsp. enterica serovar Seattle]|nr:hypothetical protein [Salmonella enterica subsp. enterica serovar Seattle]EED6909906.1 hypothetical protein [Salmonella enterica subsp. enterica serovar Lerum]